VERESELIYGYEDLEIGLSIGSSENDGYIGKWKDGGAAADIPATD
jgi:hypothetical protein